MSVRFTQIVQHHRVRPGGVLLRLLALILALGGLAITITAVADFYYTRGLFDQPRYTHWLWFGVPMLLVGLMLCHWTFADTRWGTATPQPPRSPIIKAPASKTRHTHAQQPTPTQPTSTQSHVEV